VLEFLLIVLGVTTPIIYFVGLIVIFKRLFSGKLSQRRKKLRQSIEILKERTPLELLDEFEDLEGILPFGISRWEIQKYWESKREQLKAEVLEELNLAVKEESEDVALQKEKPEAITLQLESAAHQTDETNEFATKSEKLNYTVHQPEEPEATVSQPEEDTVPLKQESEETSFEDEEEIDAAEALGAVGIPLDNRPLVEAPEVAQLPPSRSPLRLFLSFENIIFLLAAILLFAGSLYLAAINWSEIPQQWRFASIQLLIATYTSFFLGVALFLERRLELPNPARFLTLISGTVTPIMGLIARDALKEPLPGVFSTLLAIGFSFWVGLRIQRVLNVKEEVEERDRFPHALALCVGALAFTAFSPMLLIAAALGLSLWLLPNASLIQIGLLLLVPLLSMLPITIERLAAGSVALAVAGFWAPRFRERPWVVSALLALLGFSLLGSFQAAIPRALVLILALSVCLRSAWPMKKSSKRALLLWVAAFSWLLLGFLYGPALGALIPPEMRASFKELLKMGHERLPVTWGSLQLFPSVAIALWASARFRLIQRPAEGVALLSLIIAFGMALGDLNLAPIHSLSFMLLYIGLWSFWLSHRSSQLRLLLLYLMILLASGALGWSISSSLWASMAALAALTILFVKRDLSLPVGGLLTPPLALLALTMERGPWEGGLLLLAYGALILWRHGLKGNKKSALFRLIVPPLLWLALFSLLFMGLGQTPLLPKALQILGLLLLLLPGLAWSKLREVPLFFRLELALGALLVLILALGGVQPQGAVIASASALSFYFALQGGSRSMSEQGRFLGALALLMIPFFAKHPLWMAGLLILAALFWGDWAYRQRSSTLWAVSQSALLLGISFAADQFLAALNPLLISSLALLLLAFGGRSGRWVGSAWLYMAGIVLMIFGRGSWEPVGTFALAGLLQLLQPGKVQIKPIRVLGPLTLLAAWMIFWFYDPRRPRLDGEWALHIAALGLIPALLWPKPPRFLQLELRNLSLLIAGLSLLLAFSSLELYGGSLSLAALLYLSNEEKNCREERSRWAWLLSSLLLSAGAALIWHQLPMAWPGALTLGLMALLLLPLSHKRGAQLAAPGLYLLLLAAEWGIWALAQDLSIGRDLLYCLPAMIVVMNLWALLGPLAPRISALGSSLPKLNQGLSLLLGLLGLLYVNWNLLRTPNTLDIISFLLAGLTLIPLSLSRAKQRRSGRLFLLAEAIILGLYAWLRGRTGLLDFLEGWDGPVLILSAFLLVGLSRWLKRRRQRLGVKETELLALFLPVLLPLVMDWDHSLSGLGPGLAALLYGLMARQRKQNLLVWLALFSLNLALAPVLIGYGVESPAAWLLPVGLSLVFLTQRYGQHMGETRGTLRSFGALLLLGAASAEHLYAPGIMPALLLGLFSILGVLVGIAWRIRAFLQLGFGFLILDLAYNLGRWGAQDRFILAVLMVLMGLLLFGMGVWIARHKEKLIARYREVQGWEW